jgi:serine/threonine-protein kinase HipA
MAQRVGLGALAAEEIIEQVLDRAPSVAAAMYRALPDGFPKELADSILQGMLRQCAKLQGQSRGR